VPRAVEATARRRALTRRPRPAGQAGASPPGSRAWCWASAT